MRIELKTALGNDPLLTASFVRPTSAETAMLAYKINPIEDLSGWDGICAQQLIELMFSPSTDPKTEPILTTLGKALVDLGPQGMLIDLASGTMSSSLEEFARTIKSKVYIGVDPNTTAQNSTEAKYIRADMLAAMTALKKDSASIVTIFAVDLLFNITPQTPCYVEALGNAIKEAMIPGGILILDNITAQNSGLDPRKFGFTAPKELEHWYFKFFRLQ